MFFIYFHSSKNTKGTSGGKNPKTQEMEVKRKRQPTQETTKGSSCSKGGKTKNLNTEGNFEKQHFQNAAENRVTTQY